MGCRSHFRCGSIYGRDIADLYIVGNVSKQDAVARGVLALFEIQVVHVVDRACTCVGLLAAVKASPTDSETHFRLEPPVLVVMAFRSCGSTSAIYLLRSTRVVWVDPAEAGAG